MDVLSETEEEGIGSLQEMRMFEQMYPMTPAHPFPDRVLPRGPRGYSLHQAWARCVCGGWYNILGKLHGGSSLWGRSDRGDCSHQTGLPDLSGSDGTWE